jgi:hypothetical protein
MVKPQLSIRTLLEITAVVAVILAIYFGRSSGEVGRYALFQSEKGAVLLLDTRIGQCWWKASDGTWHDSVKPIK